MSWGNDEFVFFRHNQTLEDIGYSWSQRVIPGTFSYHMFLRFNNGIFQEALEVVNSAVFVVAAASVNITGEIHVSSSISSFFNLVVLTQTAWSAFAIWEQWPLFLVYDRVFLRRYPYSANWRPSCLDSINSFANGMQKGSHGSLRSGFYIGRRAIQLTAVLWKACPFVAGMCGGLVCWQCLLLPLHSVRIVESSTSTVTRRRAPRVAYVYHHGRNYYWLSCAMCIPWIQLMFKHR